MKTRREQQREQTYAEIQAQARQQMAETGSAAISMRAIARAMGLSAPALYRYYDNRDALLTELILQGFNALADAVTAARDSETKPPSQLMAMTMAYRDWAVSHPVDFQLLYGNPVPDYDAPAEITTPAASRTAALFAGVLHASIAAGQSNIPPQFQVVPEPYRQATGNDPVMYMVFGSWAFLHGLLSLEVNNHLNFLGDLETFYRDQLTRYYQSMGLKLD